MKAPAVNFRRLKEDIETLSRIGRGPDRGIYRMAFTDADMEAREWLMGRIREAGLDLQVDGAANIHGRLGFRENESRPSLVVGSHIDSVPGGGHLDGVLGVLAGLESLRRLKEEGVETTHPVELISFSDEEGRFGGLFGSQAFCGELTPEMIHNAVDLDGVSIHQAMETHGLNAMEALHARRSSQSVRAYLELHIEQGPVLDAADIPVGVVENITGLLKWNVRLIGTANHAGTTPMHMRKDAFLGLAELSGEIPRILEEEGGESSVATIGRVQLSPGAANTVPGIAEFTMDIRDGDPETLKNMGMAFRRTLSAIARRRDLMFEFEVLNEVKPVRCDEAIVNLIDGCRRDMELEGLRMDSGAAHDALIMANIAPVGMIFVPSKGGKSHSPAEWTPWEDIRTGSDLLLNALYRMATE